MKKLSVLFLAFFISATMFTPLGSTQSVNRPHSSSGFTISDFSINYRGNVYKFVISPLDSMEFIVELGCRLDTGKVDICLLYTSPSPRDRQKSRMPSSA